MCPLRYTILSLMGLRYSASRLWVFYFLFMAVPRSLIFCSKFAFTCPNSKRTLFNLSTYLIPASH